MRLTPCKYSTKGHYFEDNICIHCGLDYNKLMKEVKGAEGKLLKELADDVKKDSKRINEEMNL